MDVSLTIKCATFWDAMMLRDMLEEQGVRVHWPDEGGVVLSMVASGALDRIKAAAAQLSREFPRSGRIIVGDTDHDDDPGHDDHAGNDEGTGHDDHAGNDEGTGHDDHAGNDEGTGHDDDAGNDEGTGHDDHAGNDEGADDAAYLAADLDRDDI